MELLYIKLLSNPLLLYSMPYTQADALRWAMTHPNKTKPTYEGQPALTYDTVTKVAHRIGKAWEKVRWYPEKGYLGQYIPDQSYDALARSLQIGVALTGGKVLGLPYAYSWAGATALTQAYLLYQNMGGKKSYEQWYAETYGKLPYSYPGIKSYMPPQSSFSGGFAGQNNKYRGVRRKHRYYRTRKGKVYYYYQKNLRRYVRYYWVRTSMGFRKRYLKTLRSWKPNVRTRY